MAMTCISGSKECSGCMACHEDREVYQHCPMCGHILDSDDMVYRLREDAEVVGCEHCVESVFAEDM